MEQDQVVSLEAHVERRKEKEGEEPKELYYLVSNVRLSLLCFCCAFCDCLCQHASLFALTARSL